MLGLKVEGRVASLEEILDPDNDFDGSGVPVGVAGDATNAPGGFSAAQQAQIEQIVGKVVKEQMQSVMTEQMMPQFKHMFEGAFSQMMSVAGYKSSVKGKGRAEPEPESDTEGDDEDQPVSEFDEVGVLY